MSEHGWPDDHHDDGGFEHHDTSDPLGPDNVVPDAEPVLADDDTWQAPDPVPADHDVPYEPQEQPQPAPADTADAHHLPAVGADPDTVGDHDEPAGVFPPPVDVGQLPEPVDGFPWIDTGSLGLADLTAAAHDDVPDPAELAQHAAVDLPPGVDPWAALAESQDPAISALARFWGSARGPDQP